MERALLLIAGFSHEAVSGGGSRLQRSHCGGRMLWQPRLDGNSAAGTTGIQLNFLFLNSKDKKTAGKEGWLSQ